MNKMKKTHKAFQLMYLALTIVLVTLKLTGYISLSWIAVLSPIWLPILLSILFGLLICTLYSAFALVLIAIIFDKDK